MRATYLSSLISAFSKSRAVEKNDFHILKHTHTPTRFPKNPEALQSG